MQSPNNPWAPTDVRQDAWIFPRVLLAACAGIAALAGCRQTEQPAPTKDPVSNTSAQRSARAGLTQTSAPFASSADPRDGAPTANAIHAKPSEPKPTTVPAPDPRPPTKNVAERYSHTIPDDVRQLPVVDQQAAILRALHEQGDWSPEALAHVAQVFEGSPWLSFGNPKTSQPSMTREQCRVRRRGADLPLPDPTCGAPNMVPLFDPRRGQTAADARVCIDQYEFPNLPCEYPVVWVRASEADALCDALGKRLCDAHEWEGACAGALSDFEREYPWASMPRSVKNSPRREQRLWLEYEHNRTREVRWAYGLQSDTSVCAMAAEKDARCDVVDWGTCGSNTYPAGAFPRCVSPLGAYDQHGNAAEHMNLPLHPEEMTSRGGKGWTEMKGSWFIFARQPSHPDDCRWRAKSWHTTRVTDSQSHRNYHLGFRCCKDRK